MEKSGSPMHGLPRIHGENGFICGVIGNPRETAHTSIAMNERSYSPTDNVLICLNDALETLFAGKTAERRYPGKNVPEGELSNSQQRHSARLMRINHVGEVCAQALYQSQAITARDPATREQMRQSADEEKEHLAWCEKRIHELGGRKSLLNPLWYAGSFAVGTAAGIAGDKWNLGFVAETENQVVNHLEDHLGKLPENDFRSRKVLDQMKQDESQHAEQAREAGAAELPNPVKQWMKRASRIMTRTAYWV